RLEDCQKLGDRQQILDALGQVEQLQAAALTAHRRERADDLAQASRVDVRNTFKIQDELLFAVGQQAVDLVLEQLVTFAKGHLALQVEYGDVTHRPFGDFHSAGSSRVGKTLERREFMRSK